MKMCMKHWDELKQKIKDAGLYKFVAPDGEAAAARMASAATRGPSKESFDPLMSAHNAIVAHAIDFAGLSIMVSNPDGSEKCPLCYLIDNCKCEHHGTPECDFAKWSGYAVRDATDEAKQLGLLS